MNARQAIARLAKISGRKANLFMWRENPHGLDRAEREAARAKIVPARDAHKAIREKRMALRDKLLADPTYVALLAEEVAANEMADVFVSESHRFKLTAGVAMGGFFHVLYQGDNWDDIVTNAETNNPGGK